MALIRIRDGKPWQDITDRQAVALAGQDYDTVMKDAAKVAYRRRQMAKGTRNPEGLGCFHMHVPQVLVDRLLASPEMANIYHNDKNEFWCRMWHMYPDLRCMNQPMCPNCGKKTRKITWAAS